jgi:hypothetical protein
MAAGGSDTAAATALLLSARERHEGHWQQCSVRMVRGELLDQHQLLRQEGSAVGITIRRPAWLPAEVAESAQRLP